MFFAVFWTAYIPVCMVILSLAGVRLMRSVRRLRVHAWIASSNRRRTRRGAHPAILKQFWGSNA